MFAQRFLNRWGLLALSASLLLGAQAAQAGFIKDANPGGSKLMIDVANKNASSFNGNVELAGSPLVAITTVGNVDTGSGYANIKPVKDGLLTKLTFTPVDGTLFNGFSFRGQLLASAGGQVKVTVQDNAGDPAEVFIFTGLGSNSDFGRIGIIAAAGSGDTIKSVTVEASSFKEFKQVDFDGVVSAVPLPASVWTGLSTLAALAIVMVTRHRRTAHA